MRDFSKLEQKAPIKKTFVRTEPSLEEKWDIYKRNPDPGSNIGFYNSLLEQIATEIPFKNNKEAEDWYDLGNTNYDEWVELTDALVRRKRGK